MNLVSIGSCFRTFARAVGTLAIIAMCIGFPAIAQTLRIGVATHPKTLDVQVETGNDAAQMLYNVFDTLIERDPEATPLRFRPGLAESWARVAPTTLELKLRDGVRFHDGSAMTAEDVRFSLDRVFKKQDPRYASAHGRFFYNFSHVEVVDARTVRIHAHKPEPLFEVLLSDPNSGITSAAHFARLGTDEGILRPIGTGPYRIASVKSGRETVMERHAGFWGDKAPFERLHYIRIAESAARITALVNGEVDFITNIPPDQERLIPKGRFRLVGGALPLFHVMVVNMNHPVLKDVRIRQALNLAIDRATLTKALWSGRGIPASAHQFPEYGEPLYKPGLVTIGHDVARARALVKESGYDGTPIRITFEPGYYLYFELAAQAVQEMWQAIGLKVQLEQTEGYDYANLMIRPWSNPMYYPDPMGAFDTHWSEASWTATRNLFTPRSPEWKPLYEKARFATDIAERADAYHRLIALGESEGGWILLYQPHEATAMRPDIDWRMPKALRPYTLGFRAGQISVAR